MREKINKNQDIPGLPYDLGNLSKANGVLDWPGPWVNLGYLGFHLFSQTKAAPYNTLLQRPLYKTKS